MSRSDRQRLGNHGGKLHSSRQEGGDTPFGLHPEVEYGPDLVETSFAEDCCPSTDTSGLLCGVAATGLRIVVPEMPGESAVIVAHRSFPVEHLAFCASAHLADRLSHRSCNRAHEVFRRVHVVAVLQPWFRKEDDLALAEADEPAQQWKVGEQLSPFDYGVVHPVSPRHEVEILQAAKADHFNGLFCLREVAGDHGIEAVE